MSDGVLFQKSWEEKNPERKKTLCLYLSAPQPMSCGSSLFHMTCFSLRGRNASDVTRGEGGWLPVSPWLSTNLGQIWRERRETAGAVWCLASVWGSSKHVSEKSRANFFHTVRGLGGSWRRCCCPELQSKAQKEPREPTIACLSWIFVLNLFLILSL